MVERRDLKVRGFTVDFDEVADDLESEEEALRSALNRVDAAKKKADGTLLAKCKAIDVLRRTLGWVGRNTEGLFRLAGEDELADRIRTSTRRSSGPAQTTEETAPDAPASEPSASETETSETETSDSQA